MGNLTRVGLRLGAAALLLAGLGAGAPAGAQAAGGSGYKVTQKYTVGGEGGWDYLTMDSAGRRLYLTRGNHVMVVDADSGKPLADIVDLSGTHGVALATSAGKGFISNGRASTITVFDLKTNKVIDTVKSTGENPDAIIYDPASKRVFAFNGRSKNATVLDAASGKVAGTVALDGKPEFAVSDGKGKVFVNIEDKGEVQAIDARKLAVVASWPIAGCEEPSGLAIDRTHSRLISVCGNKVMAILDASNGKLVATVPIGAGVDAAAFDPATGLAFSSNGADATLTVVHEDSPDKWTVVENVPTQKGARTMALDEKNHRVYLVTSDFGEPPAPTTEQPHPRPPMVPNTFTVLVVGK
jgi:DNA-binding beta-propeller fold protein YncE